MEENWYKLFLWNHYHNCYNTASPSTILDVTKCFEDVMNNHDDALQVLLSARVLSGNTGTVPQVNLQVSQQVAPL